MYTLHYLFFISSALLFHSLYICHYSRLVDSFSSLSLSLSFFYPPLPFINIYIYISILSLYIFIHIPFIIFFVGFKIIKKNFIYYQMS
ncbi:uncharacterized protein BX664DRAFT_61912 [Halteromyces radiatus]|uniref:uncharacterized protein n=1 Tax=Halteromyces radiatus TaxID=101107 RepID=UPI00221E43B2|nr:uncharacterized protein BX664DRAFT_61912 [Halteromyces radiatus]KAI8096589.1 hypothetical protein BX664DRAFT_61912 [Halteromyces radiatus]